MNHPAVLLLGSLLLASAASSQDWIPVDGRSRAVGGSGVAFSEGPAAAYWNPASLADGAEGLWDFSTGFGFDISAGPDVALEGDIASDFLRALDLYEDIEPSVLRDRVNAGTHTAADVQDAMTLLQAILDLDQPKKGLLIQAAGGFDLKIGPFGIFGRSLSGVGIDPFIDNSVMGAAGLTDSFSDFFQPLPVPGAGQLTAAGDALRLKLESCGLTTDFDGNGAGSDSFQLAFQAQQALGGAISDPRFQELLCKMVEATLSGSAASSTFSFNGAGIEVRSLMLHEVGVSFGLPIYPGLFSGGIALKEVIAESFYRKLTFQDTEGDQEVTDLLEDSFKRRKRDRDFNMDLGLLVTPLPGLRLGISVRNLLPMEYDLGAGGELDVDPRVRVGAAYSLWGILKFGADLDLTENDTDLLKGLSSQVVGGGVELNLAILQLRVGMTKNLASEEQGSVVTAGVGLNLYFLRLDVAAQMGLDEITLQPADPNDDPMDIPDRVGLAFTLGAQFGF